MKLMVCSSRWFGDRYCEILRYAWSNASTDIARTLTDAGMTRTLTALAVFPNRRFVLLATLPAAAVILATCDGWLRRAHINSTVATTPAVATPIVIIKGAAVATPIVPATYPDEPVRIDAPLLCATAVSPIALPIAVIVAAGPAAASAAADAALWLGAYEQIKAIFDACASDVEKQDERRIAATAALCGIFIIGSVSIRRACERPWSSTESNRLCCCR